MRIAILGCSSSKIDTLSQAHQLYNGCYFRCCYKYAKALLETNNIDKFYILSAKYHVVEENDILQPYNISLRQFNKKQKEEWSNIVLNQLKDKGINTEEDEFIFLYGKTYYDGLLPYIKHYSLPFDGIEITQRMKILYNKRIELISK